MELEKVLHMKGGSGETSFAQTSYISRKAISITKPIREEALAQLLNQDEFTRKTTTLCMVDMGCASGPNTFTVVSELVIASERIRQKLSLPKLEYQVYLNDLPGNDFNSVFKSLPNLHQVLKDEVGLGLGKSLFVGAVPGSFYGRLFPCQSLNFVHSSYSLHWLSQVPEGLEENKGSIYMSSTSVPSVVEAYKRQFQKDIALFLGSRSEELVKGGRMILTLWGRATDDPRRSTEFLDVLDSALKELASEGAIEERDVEAFNLPMYHPSSKELTEEIQKQGSFFIKMVDVSYVKVDHCENGKIVDLSKLARAALESILVNHFGKALIDDIFKRFSRIIDEALDKQPQIFTNVTLSVTRK